MTIRTRITLFSISVTLLIAGALIIAGHYSEGAAETRYVQASIKAQQLLWEKIVEIHLEKLSGSVKTVTRDKAIVNALKKRDLDALYEAANVTHGGLYMMNIADRLQIADTEGNYLAAIPEKFTGASRKTLFRRTVEEGKVQRGIAIDDDGKVQAVLAFPVYARSKLKGVAAITRDLENILNDFRANYGADAYLVNLQGRVEHAAEGNQYTDVDLNQVRPQPGGMEVVEADGKYFAIGGMPIIGYEGEPVATVVTVQDQTETYALQSRVMLLKYAIVLAILISSAFGLIWYIRRGFRPLETVMQAMSEISSGNLRYVYPENKVSNDETGQLTLAMHAMVHNLQELVGGISQATAQLSDAATRITAEAETAGRNALQEQEQTQQVANAISDVVTTVQEVAHNTEGAASAAQRANDAASTGTMVVGRTSASIQNLAVRGAEATDAINRLDDGSKQIGTILDVIQSIADQTGLLALNASIEAARAGEHGRGFAVVADEVRGLAVRTQESTREIQEMIQSIRTGTQNAVQTKMQGQEETTQAVKHAAQANETLRAITDAINEISTLSVQIASTTEQQLTAVEGVNDNVISIKTASDHSVQSVQDVARTSTDLAALSDHLSAMVERFQI